MAKPYSSSSRGEIRERRLDPLATHRMSRAPGREDMHPLDRPAWSALTTGWSRLALREGDALQLDPQYGPFAATPDRSLESLAALARFRIGEHGLWIVEPDDFPIPSGMTLQTRASIVQMTATSVAT